MVRACLKSINEHMIGNVIQVLARQFYLNQSTMSNVKSFKIILIQTNLDAIDKTTTILQKNLLGEKARHCIGDE